MRIFPKQAIYTKKATFIATFTLHIAFQGKYNLAIIL